MTEKTLKAKLRLYSTYKELKLSTQLHLRYIGNGLYSTYKELKLSLRNQRAACNQCLYSTYKELKLHLSIGHDLAKNVFILPTRN